MILYFSIRILQAQSGGGIVGYLSGLVAALAKNPALEIHAGLVPINFHEIGDHLPENVIRHQLPGLQNELWAAQEKALIERIRPDWVVYSYPDECDTYSGDGAFKTAACIPDLQHIAHPFFFPANARVSRDLAFGKAVGSADLVFTLSKYVRDHIITTYGCAESLVKIIYPSASPRFLEGRASEKEIIRTRKELGIPPRYSIFPGNFWRHKNHQRLLEAMSRLRKHDSSIAIVLTGTESLADAALRRQIAAAKREGWLFMPGYVKEAELHALISGATCLVFPSLFEGFGIPVVEALSVGVPVACSNICSLPEAGGDAVHYFDPLDVASMASGIEKALKSGAPDFKKKAKAQARLFSYDNSATAFLEALAAVKQPGRQPAYRAIEIREPMLVSIVTPSYQQGEFLRQCIESVLTQDYPHIEYCVMDGGSTDESRQILEGYGKRFYWQSGADGGQTNAINAGLRRAKGDIIAYLNSDDVLLPGAVSAVVEEWHRRPIVDLFYGRANMIDREGGVIREYDTREYNLNDFKGHCYICQPAAFWHRRVTDQLGCMNEGFQTAMDYEYWQRIAANGGLIVKLDRFLACSREYETTKTKSQRGKVFNDVFKGQLLHWGRVHPLWWRGWLNYMKMERGVFYRRLIPPAKKSERLSILLSKVIRKWDFSQIVSRDQLMGIILRSRRYREAGYYSDGWMGDAFRMPLRIRQKSRIYIEGLSPEPKKLNIQLSGQKAEIMQVGPGDKFRYERILDPGCYLLKIYSSATCAPNDDRRLGVLIQATNIFSFR